MSYYVKSIMMPTPLTADDALLCDQIAQARFELSLGVRKMKRERFIALSHWLDELEFTAWSTSPQPNENRLPNPPSKTKQNH